MKEEDIRKKEVFDKYLRLVVKDVRTFFSNASAFQTVGCPACGSKSFKREFEKTGFQYVSCKRCFTLYVNPRPPFQALVRFYSESPSTKFWVNDFFKPVANARREKIFKPRAEYVAENFSRKNKKAPVIGDIGAGFGLFLEELRKVWSRAVYVAIEPSVEMADICRGKGFEVVCLPLEEVQAGARRFDILTAFELLEHLFNPAEFLLKAHALLKPGGSLIVTTLNGQGFDIHWLWEKSKSVSPPHHLNFFNTKSLCFLLKRCGFKSVDCTTPGKLDWDIVEGMIKKEGVDAGRFWNFLANEGSGESKKELQDWISRNNFSSHMMAAAKK